MIKKLPFDEKELEVIGEAPSFFGPPTKILNKPVTGKENYRALYEKYPYWQTSFFDSAFFCPQVIPDNVARHFAFDATSNELREKNPNYDGKDMFGIAWEYVPAAGGSMVRPGKPTLEDVNDWEKVLKFPNIDEWDWEGSAAENKEYLTNDKWISISMLNGAYFERLVSFMEFQHAVVALIDEDQQIALHALFEATTDLYCRIIDKVVKYYPQVDCINFHDDWGSQQNPFFSQETAMEMIVPHGKKLVDYIHSKGKIADLHACGHIEKRVECFIEMGWDSWSPQPMNDTKKLYHEYGDKIIIGINDTMLPPSATKEEMEESAKNFAEQFCKPGRPSIGGGASFAEAYTTALYKYSRIEYSKY